MRDLNYTQQNGPWVDRDITVCTWLWGEQKDEIVASIIKPEEIYLTSPKVKMDTLIQ